MEKRMRRVIGRAGLPVTVIPNGVPDAEYRRRRIDASEPIRIGWVGRMIPQKRPDLAVAVFGSLEKRYQPGHFRLVLAGDGRELESVRRLARRRGLDDGVTFLGEVHGQALEEFYSSIDIMLFTSTRCEAFGLVLLEAMIRGIPVVGTSAGELPYLAASGGGIVSASNANRLADEIWQVTSSPEAYAWIGARARSTAEAYLDSGMVDNTFALYERVLLGPGCRRNV